MFNQIPKEMKGRKTKIILTDEQMNRLREAVRKEYPWSAYENDLYHAELVSFYEVTISAPLLEKLAESIF